VEGSYEQGTCTHDSTNTEQTQTDIHVSSGIRTDDPSVQADEDSSCLRPRGHRDWQGIKISATIINRTYDVYILLGFIFFMTLFVLYFLLFESL
jgi:hypothetical protein